MLLRFFAVCVIGGTSVACGAPRSAVTPVAHCVAPTRTTDSIELAYGRPLQIAPSCPTHTESRFEGPITFTATEDGLRVQFEVVDPSFNPGRFRDRSRARDVVVVFPSGEGPGRPTVELAFDATQHGYRVDDVVPWETWALGEGQARAFRFVCVLFDRENESTNASQVAQSESELHLSLHVRVLSGS